MENLLYTFFICVAAFCLHYYLVKSEPKESSDIYLHKVRMYSTLIFGLISLLALIIELISLATTGESLFNEKR
jgi:hypothetical protein